MPKRTDIKKIMVIGAGPIIIGQACGFNCPGTLTLPSPLEGEGLDP